MRIVRWNSASTLVRATLAGGALVAFGGSLCACSFLVDASDLGRGYGNVDASSGGGADARDENDAMSADGAPTCAPRRAPCDSTPCCAGLLCSFDQVCVTCLPSTDDCTSNQECCSGVCEQYAQICR